MSLEPTTLKAGGIVGRVGAAEADGPGAETDGPGVLTATIFLTCAIPEATAAPAANAPNAGPTIGIGDNEVYELTAP